MKKIFFDTWGWVAIAHKEDSHHQEVFSFYRSFLLKKGIPVTTDYVLAETITLLRARTDPKGAGLFIDTLLAAAYEGAILLESVGEERWQKAWRLCKKYKDKPAISFVDFTSFAVIQEHGVTQVLTADKHFEEVGLGCTKLF